ncbi:methylated-DNA--[protein]-cysteine S-methyltransferase [Burkholderia alba]|uniref:methylated-DNA--[protein]-cysteine S-methyltransferase n=1 Tax=Burkholderia alba TaxID=2683677 RepID=UPI002B06105E|nr:methylated-DNA--[protein]-cysteine S-methyltransferase [Burkholderia alba]
MNDPVSRPTEPIRYATGACSLGRILVAETARGVCAILLGDTDRALIADLGTRFPAPAPDPGAALSQRVARAAHLADHPGDAPGFPLDPHGSAFERRVWDALRTIAPGATATYGDIARALGDPRAARDVAEACAANPLAIAVPCHRVIRKDGSLAGYRWGFKRKRELLKREAGQYAQRALI